MGACTVRGMTRAEKVAQAETELVEVKAALSRLIAGGQAYAGEGRSMTRVDFAQLQQREKDLEAKLARLRRGSIQAYGVVLP